MLHYFVIYWDYASCSHLQPVLVLS